MSKISGSDQLSQINHKVVEDGEVLPQVTLKDGSRVQTGTVATMLHNIALYNRYEHDAAQRSAVEQELKVAVPTLVKIGLFDLFDVDEWIQGENAGRTFVGVQAKAYLKNLHEKA
ncbi:hypothetical protein GCM10023206_31230 [Acinetobacter puyangensis]|uniref:DUF7709 domain-containing protein n=1 Tax=Acinetobacter puyangensis TaxID=1096779 RepID=A0A240E5G8_9GAMM|nr:hypothetical protein [Acinetobacter puyangensis]SNX43110.1 hypothetical protein SAMN05421731_101144 [Acinetobacter puyangensis]